jgi:ribosomal protein S18 acetylase RimI-like enzyme
MGKALTNEHTKVVVAVPEDTAQLADVLGRAFQDDPVSTWIFPDPRERTRRQRGFLKVFLEEAMASGQVYTTPDRTGVALWRNVQPDEPQDAAMEERLAEACGPFSDRFALLGEQMDANHPHDRAHGYLQFIAVDPPWQDRGVGTALIRHRLAELDALKMPAYLESSASRPISLYERLGFRQLEGTAIHLPDGAIMRPMWREPHANGQPAG